MTPQHASLTIAGIAAVSGLWPDLGRLQEFQHADSPMPALVSTQRWTPYFWGQDRFGMVVPLVAMPVGAPLANLLLQGWIMIAAAMLTPFVVARFATDQTGQWLAAGALTHLLLFGVTAPVTQFDWLVVQPYALSLTLGFAGLVIARRGTPAGAAARLASPRQVFGLTYRSEATDALWCAPGTTEIVVSAPGDGSAIAVAARHGIALTPRARTPDATLFDARAASLRAGR